MNRNTNLLEKLIPSIINLIIISSITYLITLISSFNTLLYTRISFVLVALIYNLGIAIFNNNRCLGMFIMNTYWDKKYSIQQRVIYALLYTFSYSTIVFYIFIPFDLLIINLLFLQLPIVILKKTTLHGYLSGNMSTVVKKKD